MYYDCAVYGDVRWGIEPNFMLVVCSFLVTSDICFLRFLGEYSNEKVKPHEYISRCIP